MEKLEITSMSSRGQVVIPKEIREKLGLKEGEKFVVVRKDDIIILKKIEIPTIKKTFDEIAKPLRKAAKQAGLTKRDLEKVI